jgi:aldehyde:ferredoxin oxidoreductase
MKSGQEIVRMKRVFNVKCGITKADDTIGKRFYSPLEKGGTKKNIPPLEGLLEKYYQIRGWDAQGKPI